MTPPKSAAELAKEHAAKFNFRTSGFKSLITESFLAGHAAGIAQAGELLKALEYCALDPGLLHPANNAQHVVAANAIASFKARAGEGE